MAAFFLSPVCLLYMGELMDTVYLHCNDNNQALTLFFNCKQFSIIGYLFEYKGGDNFKRSYYVLTHPKTVPNQG